MKDYHSMNAHQMSAELREMAELAPTPDLQECYQRAAALLGGAQGAQEPTRAQVAQAFETIRLKLINCLDEPERSAFWLAVQMRDALNGTSPLRGNYEGRHPRDDILWSASDHKDLIEVVEVLGIQESDQTPADAVRELQAEIERLREAPALPEGSR